MTTTVPSDVAELTEIMAYTDFANSAAASVQEALGLSTLHAGGTRALAIREDPSHFFNRAGGFGTDRPITVDDLTQVCDFYRERGVARGSLMIAPPLLPPDWDTIASKLGLTEGSRYTKLGRDLETAPTPTGLPVLDPGWRVGVVDVAVGSVFFNGECAHMFAGATLPDARGRGAQSALLAARLRGAAAEGCRWIVAETGVEGPGEHNPSLRNLVRDGFEPMYDRVDWLWHA